MPVMWGTLPVRFPRDTQQQAPTLGSLWPQVKENYPGIGAKKAAIDAAEYNKRAVKGVMLQQVNAQAQHTYGTYEGSAGAFFPQTGLFNVSGAANTLDGSSTNGSPMAANNFGSATVEWELFSFGKLRKENEAATAGYYKAVSEKEAYLLHLKKTLRSEEHTSELQSLMRISYAVFCL